MIPYEARAKMYRQLNSIVDTKTTLEAVRALLSQLTDEVYLLIRDCDCDHDELVMCIVGAVMSIEQLRVLLNVNAEVEAGIQEETKTLMKALKEMKEEEKT